jgi:hypothetical protein
VKARFLSVAAGALGAVALVGPARADSISFGDYFFPGDDLANGFSSSTDGNVPYQASGPGTGFTVVLEGQGWAGEFVRYTTLIFDDGAAGAVTISFSSPITGITDLAAEPALPGPYTAYLDAYDGAVLVGSSSYSGVHAGGPEGTIPGFDVSAPEITSIVISTTNDTDGIAIGGGLGIPEPGAWALMLVGLGGLGAALRAKRQAETPSIVPVLR